MKEYDWIPSTAVLGLAFVFPAANGKLVLHTPDDCQGMFNVFLLEHRIDDNGVISNIPPRGCPPFPCYIESFRQLWSIDYSQMIFSGIRQIRQNMQQSLCRVAQSQGDFSVKKTKLQLPNCCWDYIKNVLTSHDEICSVSAVTYCKPKAILSWGLTMHSSSYVGSLDVIRIDTREKLEVFRQLFGVMAGFGVRKRRPRYCEGKAVLSINDVLNVISPPLNCATNASNACGFRLFGVTGDGIDLAYHASDGVLQITLRYRKMVVTNSSLASLESVGVANNENLSGGSNSSILGDIALGIQFMDDMYVMEVSNVLRNEVHAKQVYKVVHAHGLERSRTIKLQSSAQTVIYTDSNYVAQQILKMIE